MKILHVDTGDMKKTRKSPLAFVTNKSVKADRFRTMVEMRCLMVR